MRILKYYLVWMHLNKENSETQKNVDSLGLAGFFFFFFFSFFINMALNLFDILMLLLGFLMIYYWILLWLYKKS
jgi:hypothetical protein